MRRAGWIVLGLMPLACTGGAERSSAPAAVFAAEDLADGTPAENIGLPLTSLQRQPHTDSDLVRRAAHAVTRECMAAQGFDTPPLAPAYRRFGEVDHPFGPWTQEEVPEGYGQIEHVPPRDLYQEFIETLPEDQLEAWGVAYGGNPFEGPRPTVALPDGTEAESGFTQSFLDGCLAEGYDAVYGDYAYKEELRQEIEALVNAAFVEAQESDIVDQALEVWEQCMEAEGVDVEDGPDGPVQLASRFGREPGVSDEERHAAALDIRCKGEANLHDAYFVARAEVEQELIEDNQAFVDAYRELREDSLARAREIVGSEGG